MVVVIFAGAIVVVALVRRVGTRRWGFEARWLWRGGITFALGALALVLVRVANSGVAPSTADALWTAGRRTVGPDGRPVAELWDRNLAPLGDLVAWPDPLPLAGVFGAPQLLMLIGLAVALRMRVVEAPVTRVELVSGQFWWDAPPEGGEQLEVLLPGGALRARSARVGVEVGPDSGIVVVVDGVVTVEGAAGIVTVPARHGLALTPTGPFADPEPLSEADLKGDAWIAPHLLEPGPRPRRALVAESRAWPLSALLATLLVAALVGLTYVVQVAAVPSASMRPTLQEGDRVIVAKAGGAPRVRDVVVFERPEGLTGDPVLLVKRVVAVGGQTVEIIGGRVVVDGRRLSEPYLDEGVRTGEPCGPRGRVPVPAGAIFALGDNRGDSTDSRCFGPVAGRSVVGTVVRRAVPFGGAL